jgi:hypothetical protein
VQQTADDVCGHSIHLDIKLNTQTSFKRNALPTIASSA